MVVASNGQPGCVSRLEERLISSIYRGACGDHPDFVPPLLVPARLPKQPPGFAAIIRSTPRGSKFGRKDSPRKARRRTYNRNFTCFARRFGRTPRGPDGGRYVLRAQRRRNDATKRTTDRFEASDVSQRGVRWRRPADRRRASTPTPNVMIAWRAGQRRPFGCRDAWPPAGCRRWLH